MRERQTETSQPGSVEEREDIDRTEYVHQAIPLRQGADHGIRELLPALLLVAVGFSLSDREGCVKHQNL
jgi:hypothetical protein